MTSDIRPVLFRQYETAWKLANHHLCGIGDDEWLWRPAGEGPHVSGSADGGWRGDWPETEDYSLGPPSIAWLTWHIGFWWSMVLDHSFGAAALMREDVSMPADAASTVAWIAALESEWRTRLQALTPEDMAASDLTRRPFEGRPFADVVAWVTLELAKNAAEIGYARFLYAVAGAPGPIG